MHALGFIHEHQSWGIYQRIKFKKSKSFKKNFLLTNRKIILKRSDRDKFVKIVLKNAGQYCGTTGKETCAGNFAKAPPGLVDYPEEYDKVDI